MDEVSVFTALRPAQPDDAEQIRLRARSRLDAALAVAQPPAGPAGRRPFPLTAAQAGARRRPFALAAAVAMIAVAAAIIVPAALPARSGSLITAAWAVQRNSDGTITITINRALSHQGELQRVLRADGVRAYVRPIAGCRLWEPPGGIKKIKTDWKAVLFPAPGNNDRDFREIIVHPAAMPEHDALFIGGGPLPHGGLALQIFLMHDDGPPVCVPEHSPPISR